MKRLMSAGALVVSMLLAAFPATAQGTDWNAVTEAAKKEGKVVIYVSQVGVPFHRDIIKAFEAKYGIKVDVLEARAPELRERIRIEQAAGQPGADVSYNGSNTTEQQLAEGRFDPYGFLPNAAKLKPAFKMEGTILPVALHGYGILVNTRIVKPEEMPTSWKDLLDPKWKGKIHSDDLRVVGNGGVFFYATYEALGREFAEKLAAQSLNVSREYRESERRVARGEFPFYIPFPLPNIVLLKGLPVKVVAPSEGVPYARYDLAVVKGARSPNAARLLMNHFLEPESTLVHLKGGYAVPVDAPVDQVTDPEVKALLQAKLMGGTVASKMNAMLTIAKELYK